MGSSYKIFGVVMEMTHNHSPSPPLNFFPENKFVIAILHPMHVFHLINLAITLHGTLGPSVFHIFATGN